MFRLHHSKLNRLALPAALMAAVSMLLSTVPLHACCCELRDLMGKTKGEEAAEATSDVVACPHCRETPEKSAENQPPRGDTGCQLASHHRGACCEYECECCKHPTPQPTIVSNRESSLTDLPLFAPPVTLVEASPSPVASSEREIQHSPPLSALQQRALLCCWLN